MQGMSKWKPARMKDVALRCGLTESTVSHVVNRTRFVAPETRLKVLQAIRELNYQPNAHARRLARGQNDFVGLIISDIENPFFPGLIRGFESAALEGGFELPIQGQETRTIKAGDGFQIPPETPHAGGKPGDAKSRILATYIVEKGKPLASPA